MNGGEGRDRDPVEVKTTGFGRAKTEHTREDHVYLGRSFQEHPSRDSRASDSTWVACFVLLWVPPSKKREGRTAGAPSPRPPPPPRPPRPLGPTHAVARDKRRAGARSRALARAHRTVHEGLPRTCVGGRHVQGRRTISRTRRSACARASAVRESAEAWRGGVARCAAAIAAACIAACTDERGAACGGHEARCGRRPRRRCPSRRPRRCWALVRIDRNAAGGERMGARGRPARGYDFHVAAAMQVDTLRQRTRGTGDGLRALSANRASCTEVARAPRVREEHGWACTAVALRAREGV